jgi:hypothetical protein
VLRVCVVEFERLYELRFALVLARIVARRIVGFGLLGCGVRGLRVFRGNGGGLWVCWCLCLCLVLVLLLGGLRVALW